MLTDVPAGSLTGIARDRRSCSHSLRPVGGSENKTTSFFGLQPLVAHAGVEDMPIYAPAYRSGDCPFGVKPDPGARRRTRTVSRCAPLDLRNSGSRIRQCPFSFNIVSVVQSAQRRKNRYSRMKTGDRRSRTGSGHAPFVATLPTAVAVQRSPPQAGLLT